MQPWAPLGCRAAAPAAPRTQRPAVPAVPAAPPASNIQQEHRTQLGQGRRSLAGKAGSPTTLLLLLLQGRLPSARCISPFLPGAHGICRATRVCCSYCCACFRCCLWCCCCSHCLLPLLLDAPLGSDLPLRSPVLGRIGCAQHDCLAAQQQPAASCAPQTCSREQQQQQQGH